MENELRQYRSLFECAPIGIFQSTLDGRVLKVNPALARILGFESSEECISSIENLSRDLYVHPARRDELLDRAMKNGRLLNFETQFRGKDGRTVVCNLHLRVARDKDGSVLYLEGFIEDASEPQRVARALEKSEERYRSIFENTGTAAIIIEEDMTISLANAAFEKLTGFTKEELEDNLKWTEFIAFDEDLDMMKKYHVQRRQKRVNTPTEYSFTLVDRLGEHKNIFLKVDVITGTKQSIASLIDVTSVLQAKRNLLESESKLSGIIEAFEGFIYTCRRDLRITYLNKTLQRFIGEKAGDGHCYEQIYGLGQPCGWCPLEKILAGRTVKTEFLNPRDERWYYAVYSPILDIDGTVVKLQVVVIDIHQRKRAEMEMMEREQYLKKENIRLRSTIKDRYKFGGIVGKSSAMQKVYELILRAAATSINVIVYGESGTGKELVAKAIHGMSDRAGQKFVPVNCGAIPQHLLESEFFGYEKGAFTGAVADKAGYLDHADKGTLFLDELGEIDVATQVKLLRVLEGNGYTPVGGHEAKTTDVRIISATNRDLKALVEKGRIREDFFYRIHILPIYLPPLRERKTDIPLLVEYFLDKYRSKADQPRLTGTMLDALVNYDWPGNVRELQNCIHRFVNLHHLDLLDARARKNNPLKHCQEVMDDSEPLKNATKKFEKQYIEQVLKHYRWNRTKAAQSLGLGRKTLYLKMKKLKIDR